MNDTLLAQLEAIAPTRRDEPLSRHTTIGIGGPADAFVSPKSASQMRDVLTLAHGEGVPVFVLGSGSNIVIGDHGIRGITIDNQATQLLGPFEGWQTEAQTVLADTEANPLAPAVQGTCWRAEAGATFAAVSRQLSFAGYMGMEWACGIPGTIGGAVVYNAGAYGGCLGDILLRAGIWDPSQGEVVIEAEDLGLAYRSSAFTRGLMAGKAVLWAEFELWPGDAAELRARITEYDEHRISAQPRGRNAGSFFKNPPQQPAWRLLDATGLRGHRIGGAQFSEKHCNFLINAGDARASDVAALKRLAEQRVRDEFGIELENEVTLVGEGFGDG